MQNSDTETWDVIIIGAGFSGLAAGIRCAQFFKRVLVLEAHSKLGGLNSYYHKVSRQHLFSNGLHAATNFNPSSRKWGKALVTRNLGMDPESLEIYPPKHCSRISFPGFSLQFDNDPRVLEASVADRFPSQVDKYRRLVDAVSAESVVLKPTYADCWDFLRAYISSPELCYVLALPIFSYGAFQEGTVDSRVFSIIFRSLLIEGFGSPVDIKSLLDKLVDRFKALGGELQTRACVESVDTSDGKACGVRLTDGRVYQGKKILSSAGYLETGKLCGQSWGRPGTISVFQWMGAYEQPLESYGVKDTLNFVSRKSTFEWRIPGDRPWTDVFAFSAADNFQFPKPSHAHLKISTFSRAEEFRGLDPEQYKVRKQEYVDAFLKLIPEYYPGIAGVKPLAEDAFTPLTIERYTRHPGGTIYGGLDKTADGSTPVSNLYIIGNDQIGIGIIGAMASGILVSNHQLILAK